MSEPSADRVSAQRERQAWMAEAIVMMSRLCEEAEAAETERDEAQKRIGELKERLAMRSITAHFLLKADACDWHVCELEPCVSDRALLEAK